jgi:hypothetical protein
MDWSFNATMVRRFRARDSDMIGVIVSMMNPSSYLNTESPRIRLGVRMSRMVPVIETPLIDFASCSLYEMMFLL